LVVYDYLPEQAGILPMLLDQEGNYIYYAPKIWTAIGVPLFLFVLNIIQKIITPQISKMEISPKEIIALLDWIIPIGSLFIFPFVLFMAMGINIPYVKVSLILVALVFIALGNYMPKIRINESYKIKLLKKLNEPDIRSKYYRAGGYCFIIGGVIIIIVSFFMNEFIVFYILTLSIPILIMLISIPYYFFISNKKTKNK